MARRHAGPMVLAGWLMLTCAAGAALAHDEHDDGGKGSLDSPGASPQGGPPGGFSTFKVDQLGHLPLAMIGGSTPVVGSGGVRGNDIWGWTDPQTGGEYALMGRSDGTAFIDISDPVNPLYLGILPSASGNSAWRDIKTYQDHAFIVSDGNGAHGMQVFDLTNLRNVTGPPVTFTATAHYSGFTKSHNLAINEDTGVAYSVGTNTHSGGLHFVDISSPATPTALGGYSGDGYTHDVQVVTYQGPDATHQGREIAFAFNEDTLTIVDVQSKTTPVQLSRTGYPNTGYTHQGWLTEDHRYVLQNDELDERNIGSISLTRTHVWNVEDLDAPVYVGYYEAAVGSIDHNLYIRDNYAYLANYTTGLRVLNLDSLDSATPDANGKLNNIDEIAWIDTHPATDSLTAFDGAWSSYIHFDSGAIVIGDRDEGLIIVQLNVLPGDANSDRHVNALDLSALATHWLDGVDAGYMEGDFNGDNLTNALDLSLLASNWMTAPATGGANFGQPPSTLDLAGIPEPTTALLLAAGAVMLLGRQRARL